METKYPSVMTASRRYRRISIMLQNCKKSGKYEMPPAYIFGKKMNSDSARSASTHIPGETWRPRPATVFSSG